MLEYRPNLYIVIIEYTQIILLIIQAEIFPHITKHIISEELLSKNFVIDSPII